MRKEKKQRTGGNGTFVQQTGLELSSIQPLNENQRDAFSEWDDGQNIVLQGYAGTGKTFLAMYFALKEIHNNPLEYNKVTIMRSAVPSRDMGYLPGSIAEKASAYEEPYEQVVNNLYDRGDAYSIMKKKGAIDFRTTSYLRGVTYEKSIVIVDEIQNMSFAELDTIMTRIGQSTRVIFSGDFRQTDLQKQSEKAGLSRFLNILEELDEFSWIEFEADDIVRSDLVKKYIISRTKMEEINNNA